MFIRKLTISNDHDILTRATASLGIRWHLLDGRRPGGDRVHWAARGRCRRASDRFLDTVPSHLRGHPREPRPAPDSRARRPTGRPGACLREVRPAGVVRVRRRFRARAAFAARGDIAPRAVRVTFSASILSCDVHVACYTLCAMH